MNKKESQIIALFGEAEKGRFRTAYFFNHVEQVLDSLGNPPPESRGVFFAIQALLFEKHLIFFRVEEEGFSYQDYFSGLHLLEQEDLIVNVSAYCLPGVGDKEIFDAVVPICKTHHSIIITTEPDLYDYLSDEKSIKPSA